MSEPKGEMSQEKRAILAAALALTVLIGYQFFYHPPQPPQNQPQNPTQSAQQAQQGSPAAAQQSAPGKIGSQISGVSAQPAAPTPARAAGSEQSVIVESPAYRVKISNRGGVVQSWQLLRYKDEAAPPHTLDVVHSDAAQQFGWPLSISMDDSQREALANSSLYEISTPGGRPDSAGVIRAPAEVDLTWSDGTLAVTKKINFDESYIASVDINATANGQPVPFAIAWRGGFGDATAYQPATRTQVFYSHDGKVETLGYKSLGQPKQPEQKKTTSGPLDFAGIEDSYFVGAFMPPLQKAGPRTGSPDPVETNLSVTDWAQPRQVVNSDGKTEQEFVPEVAVSSAKGGPLNLRFYVGPKDLDGLKAIRPPLNQLVQFGWLTIIAEPLFYLLLWFHKFIPNYGWAIVLLTIAMNMALLPLRMKTQKSMIKMQKVAPEIRSIQDRYKKYSMRDPRKAKMNEEVMAVYSREGINPLGGCLPQVLQLPIWYGWYRMLGVTIELRQAPWFGWIRDLSAPDPYRLLPIIMAVAMWLSQKMTPMPATDPSQQRMMALLPIMFGGMFIIFPISSGLVLYILTTSVVGVAQQYFLNKSTPLPQPSKGSKKSK